MADKVRLLHCFSGQCFGSAIIACDFGVFVLHHHAFYFLYLLLHCFCVVYYQQVEDVLLKMQNMGVTPDADTDRRAMAAVAHGYDFGQVNNFTVAV